MKKKENIFHSLSKTITPIWFMRQAGRYLPEYMEVRKQNQDFLKMCYTPEVVSELTMQPIQRFDFDMAIIFSDILVILDALGFHVKFVEGVGPIVEKRIEIFSLNPFAVMRSDKLKTVYQSISKVRSKLSKEKALIGFVGAPWTLACYACEGRSSKDFHKTKMFAYNKAAEFNHLIKVLIESCVIHALNQVESGADAIQIFDSWASILDTRDYQKWVLEPLTEISRRIKEKHPGIPIIWFPKGSFAHYSAFLRKQKKYFSELIDCLGIDYSTSLAEVNEILDENLAIQGNLDPSSLLSDEVYCIDEKLREIMTTLIKRKARVFNLGHGILPQSKIENVHYVIDYVRNFPKSCS